ncbi:lambda-exonuclease family protein [Aeromicrobium piscarium]|nr:YqaJ viral recombinase family protein [Aeromicrobium piscarium]
MTGPLPGSPEHRRLVTASKAAAILGLSPWQSPYSLWCEMKGWTEPDESNMQQRRGHYLEPAILAWWRDQHEGQIDTWIEQQWYPHEDWAGCTIDAGCSLNLPDREYQVLVEAKSASGMDEWGAPGTDEIPAYYLAQVYFQLAITGDERCYVPVIGPYLEFSEYVVEADQEAQQATLAACRRFYDSLSQDEPPTLDAHPATYATVRKLHPDIEDATIDLDRDIAHEYVAASLDLKAATERERAAKTVVLDAMGTAKSATSAGTKIARRQASKHGISLVRTAKTTDNLAPMEDAS